MKRSTVLLILLGGLLAGSSHAVTITVGDDSDLMPTGPASLDGAQPMIIVDYRANLYINDSGGVQILSVNKFSFFAQGDGDVTPFLALLTADGTAAGDYDVLALGATRIGGGADFAVGAVVSLPFDDGAPMVTVPDGATLVAGIRQGTSNGNVVPFNVNSGLDTFITGGAGVTDASDLTVETDITGGGSTWSTLNGGRNYEFTVELEMVEEDSDGDGLPDAWEDSNGLGKDDNGENPNNNGVAGNPDNGASGDPDGDGLNNLGELTNNGDPNDTDTDDDTLLDNDEVLGAGERPPTKVFLADSDDDGLDDLVETNTGTFVNATDTGSDPTVRDTDGDTINDGDEVAGNNGSGFTSNPNLVDTDSDGVDDNVEVVAGTDPEDPGAFPTEFFIGDAAPLASAVTDLGAVDSANVGDVTYALQGSPYTNSSGGPEMFEIARVNFWADGAGDVTPFLTLYNGLGVAPAANYTILAIGDVITATPGEVNNSDFTVGGQPASITLESGQTMLAGFHQTAGVVPFGQPADADADFLATGQTIGAAGSPFFEDANWSTLIRTYAFNIALEPSSSVSFAIVDIDLNLALSTATVTWNSSPGVIYAIWASPDLISWRELSDNEMGVEGQTTTSYTETPLPADTGTRRYYQIRLP
ncbi:MAG: hypothetical protein ACI9MB_002680 [Verrucomicrobiales bacterium]|jgi:hypothetical protein